MDKRWWAVVRLVLIVAALVGLTGPGRFARASAGQPHTVDVQIAQLGAPGSDCEDGCEVDTDNTDDSDDDEEDD